MKRHIGVWHRELEQKQHEVGELIIDGNHIEFYSRFHGIVFPTSFIGEDGQFSYKDFVNGQERIGTNKIIDYETAENFV